MRISQPIAERISFLPALGKGYHLLHVPERHLRITQVAAPGAVSWQLFGSPSS
jgi:hypothetical protein